MTDAPAPDALTRWALENPELALWHLAKPRAEKSLLEFIRLTWPVLLPRTPFVEGRLLREISRHLEAVTDGLITRLAIAVPPGTAKSLITNVFWPAWEWGPRALGHYRYVSTSYSEHLSIRDNGYCLKLIQSEVYQALWGDRVHLDPKLRGSVKFGLIETGWRFATSVGGTGTGERGDRIIIDDPLNAKEAVSDAALEEALQYFTEVIPSRTTDPLRSAIVLIMQRLNERDPIGHVLSAGLDYDFLCLPMEYEIDHPYPSKTSLGFVDWRTEPGELLFPERFPREVVDREKKVLSSWGGEFAISGQLQQRPSPRGGGLFKRAWFKLIPEHEVRRVSASCRGWDLAGSKDGRAAFTVGARLLRAEVDGREAYVIADIFRDRITSGELRTRLLAIATRDGRGTKQSLPQDPGQAGLAQKHDLGSLLDGFDVSITPESGSKEDRARPFAAQAELGNVYIVQAPWTETLLRELETFPTGSYKDQVDALSRAYAAMLRLRTSSPGGAPVVVPAEGEYDS